ncbi:MAG TPA: Mth938-like domain-containing protein [Xanthobacteraceae bacterium]|nr:Mth938-like domain-containing protein [Xanthobacteraceae bacterium]
MDVTPLISADRQIIQSYNAGGFKISGNSYQGPVLVFPDRTMSWSASSMDNLKASDFDMLDKKDVDVVLIGCGAQGTRLNKEVAQALKARGILPETMDTGAACRTYNVLMADGRRIAAALLPL